MLHNFNISLKYEREQAQKADTFYRNILSVSEIKRFNTDSKSDMEMQRQDVDLLITRKGVCYRVSEKFREKDFGDFYIEIYSKYPDTPGWIYTGSPNAILYFTPLNIYWITHKTLTSFCMEKLMPNINKLWFNDLYKSHRTIMSKEIVIDQTPIHINLIQAHNKAGNSWETMGISLGFDILEKFGVKFLKYRVGEELVKDET